jgi:GNAT superfamily N-acetyltransferase
VSSEVARARIDLDGPLTGDAITSRRPDAGERIEFAAVEDMWAAAPAETVAQLGLATMRAADLTAVRCSALAPVTMFNAVLGVGLGAELDEDALDATVAAAHAAGCVCRIPLWPDAPSGRVAGKWLAREGFTPDYEWVKFRRPAATDDGDAPPEPSIRVDPVASTDDAAAFGAIVTEGFGLPPAFAGWLQALPGRDGWHCLLVRVDGALAAAGALFAHGDVGWLGLGATRPALRGRGGQGALLRRRAELAQEIGVSVLFTETGERVPERPSDSYRNILRAGFAEEYLRPNLVAKAP